MTRYFIKTLIKIGLTAVWRKAKKQSLAPIDSIGLMNDFVVQNIGRKTLNQGVRQNALVNHSQNKAYNPSC
jgi:hypothetical protein